MSFITAMNEQFFPAGRAVFSLGDSAFSRKIFCSPAVEKSPDFSAINSSFGISLKIKKLAVNRRRVSRQ
jgi:hypothetical protein